MKPGAVQNVADHLAQRADYVVAKNGSALGILSWVTIPEASKPHGLCCAIIPGTVLQGHKARVPIPTGRVVGVPSDLIELKAGEHTVSLSEQLPRVRDVVGRIEASLDEEFRTKGVREQNPNTDILVIGDLQMHVAYEGSDVQPIAAADGFTAR